MREQWKQELDGLQLSSAQKERIKRHVHAPIKRKKSYVPFVLPAFVALSIFLLFVYNEPNTARDVTATVEVVKGEKSKSDIIWLTVSLILLMGNYALLLVNVKKVKRWEHWAPAVWLRNRVFSKHQVWFVLGILAMQGIIWAGFMTLAKPTLFLQGFFSVFFTLFIIQGTIFLLRNDKPATCPHCEYALTRKEIRKRSDVMKEHSCPNCDEKFYRHMKTDHAAGGGYMISPLIIALGNWTNLNLWYVIGIAIVISAFAIIYYTPYTTAYEKEKEKDDLPPPLW